MATDQLAPAEAVRFVQFEYGRVNILTHFLLRDFWGTKTSWGRAIWRAA
jgi:hypothetical protein